MPEMLNVKIYSTGEELTIPDVEPTKSALEFWQLSDQIWQQRPDDYRTAFQVVESKPPAAEAWSALNETLSGISPTLAAIGSHALTLTGMYPNQSVEIKPGILQLPNEAGIETFNWDARNTYRPIDHNGKDVAAEFTDGHLDKHRELSARFNYLDDTNGNLFVISHSMQRIQYNQDQQTSLYTKIWHSDFAEMGYEGTVLGHAELTTEQELAVLSVFRKIGGISINSRAV